MAGTITYGTQVIPETTRPASPPLNLSDTRNVVGTLNLGRGVLRPFVRNSEGDFANSNDLDLIRAEVGQTLGTIASSGDSRGEVPWRPEFGSLLYRLRYQNLDSSLVEITRAYVAEAIQTWNPRVRIRKTVITPDLENNLLSIVLRYDILATRNRSAISENEQVQLNLRLAG
jgi:phage baseplate assembly protein W